MAFKSKSSKSGLKSGLSPSPDLSTTCLWFSLLNLLICNTELLKCYCNYPVSAVKPLHVLLTVKPTKPMTWAAMASKTPASSSSGKTPTSSSAGRAAVKSQQVVVRSPPEQKPDATPVTSKPRYVTSFDSFYPHWVQSSPDASSCGFLLECYD